MRSTVLLQCLLLVWSIPALANVLNAVSNSNTGEESASATLSSAAAASATDSSAASTTETSSPSSAAPSSTSTDSAAASPTTSSVTSTTSTISTTASSSSPTTMSTTISSTASASPTSSSAPFKWDGGEIAATAILLGFISIGAASIIMWWIRRARRNRQALAAERGAYSQAKLDAAGMAERGLHPESHPMIQFGAMPERDPRPSSHQSIYQHQSTAYTGGLEQYPERQPTVSSTHSTVPHSLYSTVSSVAPSQRSPSPMMSQWQRRRSRDPGLGLHREFSIEGQDQSLIPAALTPGGKK